MEWTGLLDTKTSGREASAVKPSIAVNSFRHLFKDFILTTS